ncbi:MAG: diacylglycerol kinase family protein [Gaiellales bacterium]
MQSRPLVVVNPAARNGGVGRAWETLAAQLTTLGIDAETTHTERPGHATELVRAGLREGPRLVVAVGGDGTVNEVVNGFYDGDTPLSPASELAVVPIGTGRDGVRTYGISGKPERAIALLADGATRTIDLGRATYASHAGAEESRLFLNIASCGLSGAVAERANRTSKRLGGTPAFLWATIATFARWKNVPFTVTLDGERRELVANNTIVANGRYFGGGMHIAPDARPDDGELDAIIFGDVGRLDLALNMHRLYNGTILRHPKASHRLARVISVETARPLPIEIDGEQSGVTPVRFEVVPAALRLRVPKA